jgi:hypothetical protein
LSEASLHDALDVLLKAHVKDGVVDYTGLKANEKDLDAYLTSLNDTDPDALSKNAAITFWLNAYNAFTLKLVLDHYPVTSIKDIPDFPSAERWKAKRWAVNGEWYSLDQIEHKILRGNFQDPRVHFALVCGAQGCPDLTDEAFRSDTIDTQLTEAGERFLSDAGKGARVTVEDGVTTLHLSAIFKWFQGDFEVAGQSLVDAVLPYLSEEAQKAVQAAEGEVSVEFMDYDWSLNGQ